MSLEIGIEKRQEILKFSLVLEGMTSAFLSKLMGIDKYRETISFGNKNSSLSFNQKIGLLIDIGALSSDLKSKFITFMEIRNQFMHNLEAKDYESCFSFLDGKDKYLLRLYPQKEALSKEEQLEKATSDLSLDILKNILEIFKIIKEKIQKEVETDLFEKLIPILAETIDKLSNIKQ